MEQNGILKNLLQKVVHKNRS